jgi:hypothetical protein
LAPRKHGALTANGKRRYSESETAQQRALITNMICANWTVHQMYVGMRKQFGVGRVRTEKLRDEVLRGWAALDEEMRPHHKAIAVRNLTRWITKAEKDKRWHAVAAFHSQLMDVQGTREPLKLDVNAELKASLASAVFNLTPEQMQEMLEQRRELERQAALGRAGGVVAGAPDGEGPWAYGAGGQLAHVNGAGSH